MAVPLLVASAVIGAYGAKKAGDNAQDQANYQAMVARNNAVIAAQYATAERQKGQVLEDAKRMETAQRVSAVRAAGGSSGLDVNSGSALDLQADTARLGELDALTIRNNAARAAYGYETQGVNYNNQATLSNMAGNAAQEAGTIGMFSSVIGAASSYYGMKAKTT